MSKLHDKQRYLEETKRGRSHRQISKLQGWSVSPSIIRDELIHDGVIVQKYVEKADRLNHVYYSITGKHLALDEVQITWEDGTPKSRGNAFDLSTTKGLFNKAELAAAVNKGKPNNYSVIAYSRA